MDTVELEELLDGIIEKLIEQDKKISRLKKELIGLKKPARVDRSVMRVLEEQK